MSEIRELIEQLVDAGVDPITAAEVVTRAALIGSAQSEKPQRSKAAERQARYRERNKASQNVTNRNEVTENVTRYAEPCEEIQKTPHTPQKKNINIYTPPMVPPSDGCDVEFAVKAFNAMATAAGIPLVQKLTSSRKSKLRNRLKDCGGMSGWVQALEKVQESPFLTGDNPRGWKADFDFLLQEKSFTKLMEGGYRRTKNRQQNDMEFWANYATEDLQ